MEYDIWITRERRLRLQFLRDSHVIQEHHIYRMCQNCDEVVLCHEETCPNCLSQNIMEQRIEGFNDDMELMKKIRCFKRYEKLAIKRGW